MLHLPNEFFFIVFKIISINKYLIYDINNDNTNNTNNTNNIFYNNMIFLRLLITKITKLIIKRFERDQFSCNNLPSQLTSRQT